MPAAKRRILRGLLVLALAVATAAPVAASLPRRDRVDVDPAALLAAVEPAPVAAEPVRFALFEEAPGDRFGLLDPAAVEHVVFTGRAPRPHLFPEPETRVRAIDFPGWTQRQEIQWFAWESASGVLRWRKTNVPGPTGLDDPPQVVVEILQPGSPFSGQARTYTCLTDELGTVVGLVAEDEGTDPNAPPVPVRYRYTPYGEAHAETGPELLRARFDGDAVAVETSAGTVSQTVADELTAAAGGIVLRWSIPLDEATLATGFVVEQFVPGSGWAAVPAGELAMGPKPQEGLGTADDQTELRILLTQGWQRATSYRVRLTPDLEDRLGRTFGRTETLQWTVPAAEEGQPIPPVQYDQRFPTTYESYEAAGATAGSRFPGGQTHLFQGLWTDPVTGLAYARARWYDARNASWLSEDPLLDVDSPNLYAFVAWQPTMATDPLGLATYTIFGRSFEVPDALDAAIKRRVGRAVGVGLEVRDQFRGLLEMADTPGGPMGQMVEQLVAEDGYQLDVQRRLLDAYQQGGAEGFLAEHAELRPELLQHLWEQTRGLPVLHTVDAGIQAANADSPFEQGLNEGRGTVRLAEDVALIFGLRAGARSSAVPRRISTPTGPAVQELSEAALAARSQVEQGATLYRMGTTGRSGAAEAQFWALEHPSTPGFASRYGIPPENIQNFNFIETGTLRRGTPFVTRQAPPVGPNVGGGIEVPVPESGVRLRSFSHLGGGD